MQNTKRVIHPVIKHRLDVKLQRKINVADSIRTWSIVRGDQVIINVLVIINRWRLFQEKIKENKEKSLWLTENLTVF